jgi:hypothetical protein
VAAAAAAAGGDDWHEDGSAGEWNIEWGCFMGVGWGGVGWGGEEWCCKWGTGRRDPNSHTHATNVLVS